MYAKKIRVIDITDRQKILYIRHLGTMPYNEIKFECGKKIVVCYTLKFWHSIFKEFEHINRGILINPEKIISQHGLAEVELSDHSKFLYSRRKFKK